MTNGCHKEAERRNSHIIKWETKENIFLSCPSLYGKKLAGTVDFELTINKNVIL